MTGSKAAAPNDERDLGAAAPVLAMLRALQLPALAELEHVLSLRLEPAPTPAERRWAELGLLARLLNELEPPPGQEVPRFARRIYEQHRARHAPHAPDPRTLVEHYGSWRRACRAAYGLLPDGRYAGVGNPWPSPLLGQPGPAKYTRDDVRESIRCCALELGRIPSSHDYHRWTREKKRRARLSGASIRYPSISVLYRLYKKGESRWRLALADARLNRFEIAQARARKLLGRVGAKLHAGEPLARLRRLSAEQLAAADISAEELAQIESEGFAWLPLSRAAALARHLGGSLDWLAGRATRPGTPPEKVALQPDTLARLLASKKVKPKTLREQLDLSLGPYRDLLNGVREPLLAELVVISHELESPIDGFVLPPPPSGEQAHQD